MKNSLKKQAKVGLSTTLVFLFGFVLFDSIFQPFWSDIALSSLSHKISQHKPSPDFVGAFLETLLLATPLFLPYFIIMGVITTSIICTKKRAKHSRFIIEILSLSPFMLFNLLCFIFVSGDWTGPEYILGNDVLFLLGLFLIILPSTGAFIYFNERYYKQCQGE